MMLKRIKNACWLALLITLAGCHHKKQIFFRHFEAQPSGVTMDLTATWFADSLHGYATGGLAWREGVLLSTADAGRSWHIDTLLNRRLECVMVNPQGVAFACGQDGFLLRRRPAESCWRLLRTDWRQERSCFFPDDHRGVVVALEGEGRTLGPTGPEHLDTVLQVPTQLEAVWFSDSLTVHTVGLGWVLRSADGGRHWARMPVTGDFYRAVHFPTPEVGYICGYNGQLLKTQDKGLHWTEIRRGGAVGRRHQPFTDVWFVSPEHGYLVGEGGLFWRTIDGGSHWEEVGDAPDPVDFSAVFAFADGRGWAVGNGGKIFYFEE